MEKDQVIFIRNGPQTNILKLKTKVPMTDGQAQLFLRSGKDEAVGELLVNYYNIQRILYNMSIEVAVTKALENITLHMAMLTPAHVEQTIIEGEFTEIKGETNE